MRVLYLLAASAASDEALAHRIRDRFLATRRTDLGHILDRAVAQGEITAEYAALTVDLVYGTLWYRLIFRIGSLDYTWADDMASAIPPPPADGTGRHG